MTTKIIINEKQKNAIIKYNKKRVTSIDLSHARNFHSMEFKRHGKGSVEQLTAQNILRDMEKKADKQKNACSACQCKDATCTLQTSHIAGNSMAFAICEHFCDACAKTVQAKS